MRQVPDYADDRYRYRVLQDDGLRVKIVIREYLAAEICWD